jgi:hypothetical protein
MHETDLSKMSTGGEVANALVCKTSIRGFNSLPVLQYSFDVMTTSSSSRDGCSERDLAGRRVELFPIWNRLRNGSVAFSELF